MPEPAVLTKSDLLRHWQSHRGLTRRTIDAFPADALFDFRPALPMRAFGPMVFELIEIMKPTLAGLEGQGWTTERERLDIDDKDELLAAWDAAGEHLEAAWARIPAARFSEEESVYGFPERPLVHLVLYLIDNEIHHRGQGYVYLRKLGIEPPSFYKR